MPLLLERQLKKLLRMSKQNQLLKINNKFENLNLILAELRPKIHDLQRQELLRILFRDIDFLCEQGILGYKVQIHVEENFKDKILNAYNN